MIDLKEHIINSKILEYLKVMHLNLLQIKKFFLGQELILENTEVETLNPQWINNPLSVICLKILLTFKIIIRYSKNLEKIVNNKK